MEDTVLPESYVNLGHQCQFRAAFNLVGIQGSKGRMAEFRPSEIRLRADKTVPASVVLRGSLSQGNSLGEIGIEKRKVLGLSH